MEASFGRGDLIVRRVPRGTKCRANASSRGISLEQVSMEGVDCSKGSRLGACPPL